MKYIGCDVHISSVTFAVQDQEGKLLNQQTLPLNEELILEYVTSMKGPKTITFEEGTLAQWMHNILYDKVDKLIVCNPLENAKIYKGNKNDDIDSVDLATLLRLNVVKEVVHPRDRARQELRELVHLWFKLQKDRARIKNRLKATFRMKGIRSLGQKIYHEKNRKEWLEKLPQNSMAQTAAKLYWKQLEFLTQEKEELYKKLQEQPKKFKEIKEFMKKPGVGLITAGAFSASLFTPFRFARKSQVWGYCGLSLEEHDSSKEIDKVQEKKRRKKVFKRLTRTGNRKLKSVLKSAAQVACHRCKDNEFKEKYLKLRARGLSEDSAILTLARSCASRLWGAWKELERKKIGKKKEKA